MDNFVDNILKFVDNARPLVIAVVAAALFIIGIMLIYPSDRSKEKGKAALPWVLIGSAIALSAVTIAGFIESNF